MKDYEKLPQEHFNKHAPINDQKNSNMYYCLPKIYSEDVADFLKDKKFESILNIGSSAAYLLEYLDNNENIKYTGLDTSEKMPKAVKEKFENNKDLNFVKGSAMDLPFEDNSFDVVTCTPNYHNYPFPIRALTEAARVLKKDGIFILFDTETKSPSKWNFISKFKRTNDFRAYNKKDIEKILNAIGFKNIKSKNIEPSFFRVTAQNK